MPAAHGGLGRVLGKSGAAPLGGMHPASVSMEYVRDVGSDPWVGKIPWPSPVLLPGKSHGWRSLVGYSPWDRQESRHNWATNTALSVKWGHACYTPNCAWYV